MIAAQCVAAQIRDLNKTGEFTVHKKRCLRQPLDLCPERPLLMKVPHQISVLSSYRLIIVVDKDAVRLRWAIPDEELLKSRYNLFERLFRDSAPCAALIEMELVNCLRKHHSEIPVRHALSNLIQHLPTLIES